MVVILSYPKIQRAAEEAGRSEVPRRHFFQMIEAEVPLRYQGGVIQPRPRGVGRSAVKISECYR